MQTEASLAADCASAESLASTVLVVDSDPAAADTLAGELLNRRYQTRVAHSAGELFEQLRRQRPGAIVLDARLPDADGFALALQLNGDVETREIPLILLSTLVRVDITRRACTCGCQFVVRKPCDIDSLVMLLDRAMTEISR